MTVFILFNDDDDIVGVYSTLELAESKREKERAEYYDGETGHMSIEEYKLDV